MERAEEHGLIEVEIVVLLKVLLHTDDGSVDIADAANVGTIHTNGVEKYRLFD